MLERNALHTADIILKVDACNMLTTESCDLVIRWLEADQEQKPFKPEKERVRIILSRDEYGSVFGDTITASVLNEDLHKLSVVSKTSSKRADAEPECRTWHICGRCGRRHATCLHEEEEKQPGDEVNIAPTTTRGEISQRAHKALSRTLFHKASTTSSIVPVFVSSDKEPQWEILTYAHLDTQSDFSFVLESLVKALNVMTHPLQLKLSTMTG